MTETKQNILVHQVGDGGRPTTSQDLTETAEGSDKEKTICLKEKDVEKNGGAS
jgi:hypothetical protein